MKTNTSRKLVTLLIMGCVILFSTSIAHSAVLYVPGEYSGVQDAIDAAGAGDTIIIAAGVYEEIVTLEDDLTLVGLGLPTIGTPSMAGLSAATNCIIDGLKIHSLSISGKNNVIVKNCVILGVDSTLTSMTITGPLNDIVIIDNTFSDECYGGAVGARGDI